MVQGRLLTTHLGGVHGGGEAPGGDPPLRQGAGKSSPGAPDLGSGGGGGTEMRSRKKGSRIEGFGTRYKYMPKGGISGGPGGPGPPRRGQEGGRATRAPGALVAPPAVLRAHGSFWNADFLYNFSGFFWAVLET